MSINWGAVNDVLMSGMRGYGMREDMDEKREDRKVRKAEREARTRELEKQKVLQDELALVDAQSMQAPPVAAPAAEPAVMPGTPVDMGPNNPAVPLPARPAAQPPAQMAVQNGAAPQQPKVAKDPYAIYRRRVQMARERGNSELEKKYQDDLFGAIDRDVRSQAREFEQRVAPLKQRIELAVQEGKEKTLPKQLQMEAAKINEEYEEFQERGLASMWLNFNLGPAGQARAARTFDENSAFFGGAKFGGLVMSDDGKKFRVIDKNTGKPVMNADGKEFEFSRDEAEQSVKKHYKRESKIFEVEPGKKLVSVDNRGKATEVYSAPDKPEKDKESASQGRLRVKDAVDQVSLAFGAKMDPVSKMIDGESIKDRDGYERAIAEVEKLVEGGMSPMQAASQIAQKYRRSQAMKPDAKAGAPAAAPARNWRDFGLPSQ